MFIWRDRETDVNLNCTILLNLMKLLPRMLCHAMHFNVPFRIYIFVRMHYIVACGTDSASKSAVPRKIKQNEHPV